MPELIEIVNTNLIDLVNNIRINLARTRTNATNKTSQSLRGESTQEGSKVSAKLFGRAFFNSVRDGRRPTPNKKPSREFIENLKPWAGARGIPESAVWAIATKINKLGTNLFREGGRTDIVEPAVEKFIYDVESQWLDEKMDQIIIKAREIGNGS